MACFHDPCAILSAMPLLLLVLLARDSSATSSFLSPYRGFSLFLMDKEIKDALQGDHIANELSIFENGFENRWLTSSLSVPRITLAPSKDSIRFQWENTGKYSLHYRIGGSYRGNTANHLGNTSPQPRASIANSGFILPGKRETFEVHFECTPNTVGDSILEISFDIGQTLATSLFFYRTCTEEYARKAPLKTDLTSNSYEDLLSQETEIQEAVPARNRSDPVCLLAKRYCGFPSSSECPQEPVCRRVCRMPKKRSGERQNRICNASVVVTATLVSTRPRKHGRCGTVLHFATRFAQSYSKGARSSYIGFGSLQSKTFRVVVPEELARCSCFADLKTDNQYILTGRWNAAKSRLHLDEDSLVVRLRRKLRAYLFRTTCTA